MFELESLVADLQTAIRDSSPQLAVREVVSRAMALPFDELLRALGPCDEADLRPLFRSSELTLLKVTWSPGLARPPPSISSISISGFGAGDARAIPQEGASPP